MNEEKPPATTYAGFEQGPIRPPSEARSLLIRVTRNCPWNRCAFCPVYKSARFSVRPVEDVKKDIDLVYKHVEALRRKTKNAGRMSPDDIRIARADVPPGEEIAHAAAFGWLFNRGKKSVFIQDANSLVIKAADMVEILLHLRKRFPEVERITSYARARTVARKSDADLASIRNAGLDRIHIGLESGSDEVLALVQKGVTKEVQILAGLKAKKAGMEVSEYVIPGLGGEDLSRTHALETADALNQINPHFIRIRTLALPPQAPLFAKQQDGTFKKCTDLSVVQELLVLIGNLDGITSVVKSDHTLNLFLDLEGELPGDKQLMTGKLSAYLDMDPEEQRIFQLGRRLGIFVYLDDLWDSRKRAEAEKAYRLLRVTPDNLDEITDQMMIRFI